MIPRVNLLDSRAFSPVWRWPMRKLLLGVLGLAGCAGAMRATESQFEPLSNGEFKYTARFHMQTPLDAYGDEVRKDMLDGWLDENHLCPAGYVITDRQIAKAGDFLGAPHGNVILRGRCK